MSSPLSATFLFLSGRIRRVCRAASSGVSRTLPASSRAASPARAPRRVLLLAAAAVSLALVPGRLQARANSGGVDAAPGKNGTLSFTATTYQADENAGSATITVQRVGGGVGVVAVDYATDATGTAVDGKNYTATSGTLIWTDGDTAPKAFSVEVLDDGVVGPDVTVGLRLNRPRGGAGLGTPVTATLTVSNTDVAATPTPTPIPTPTPVPTPTPPPTPTPAAASLAITSPPVGVKVVSGAPLSLAASVLDPNQVLTRVQFFINGQPFLQFPVTGPFVTQTSAPAPGTYEIELVAVDSLGGMTTVTRTLTVVAADAGDPLPATTLLTDLAGRTVHTGAVISLTALADALRPDGGTLAQVSFYADNTLIASFDGSGRQTAAAGDMRRTAAVVNVGPARTGTVFRAPWTVPAEDGLVNLTTVATTAAGRTQVSAPVTVRVTTDTTNGLPNNPPNSPPAVVMNDVTDGAQVGLGGTLTIPVTVADPDAQTGTAARITTPGGVVARVEYYVNQTRVGTSLQSPYQFTFTPTAAGTYVLNTIATDGAGLSGVAPPVILQVNVPTTVTLLVPGSGQAIEGGAPVKVKVLRSGDLSLPLTVAYRVKGSAAPDVDYAALSGTVTIPAGAAGARIKVRALDSGAADGDKLLKLVVQPSAAGAYTVGTPGQAKVRIINVNP